MKLSNSCFLQCLQFMSLSKWCQLPQQFLSLVNLLIRLSKWRWWLFLRLSKMAMMDVFGLFRMAVTVWSSFHHRTCQRFSRGDQLGRRTELDRSSRRSELQVLPIPGSLWRSMAFLLVMRQEKIIIFDSLNNLTKLYQCIFSYQMLPNASFNHK